MLLKASFLIKCLYIFLKPLLIIQITSRSWHLTSKVQYLSFLLCSFVAKNPCSSDPGCDHVCYTSDDQPLCACFANYELQSNRKTCKGTGLVSLFRNRLSISLLWDNLNSRFANLFQTQFEMVGKILLAGKQAKIDITKSRFSICVYNVKIFCAIKIGQKNWTPRKYTWLWKLEDNKNIAQSRTCLWGFTLKYLQLFEDTKNIYIHSTPTKVCRQVSSLLLTGQKKEVFFVLGLAVTYTFGRFSKNITMSLLIANQNLSISAYHSRASAKKFLFFFFFLFSLYITR